MKNIFKFITIGIALLAGTITTNAQWNKQNGVATAKNVSEPDEHGLYTITLETYATGESAITETGVPVDIVLVLDVSGSMNEMMYNYFPTNQAWTYNNLTGGPWYYKHTDGEYYQVQRSGNSNSNRRLYFQVPNGYYGNTTWYLNGTGAQTQQPQGRGPNATIFTGTLSTRTEKGVKIDALKTAVTAFVNEVHHNSLYDTDGNLRGTPLDNQISIVKFANDRYYGNSESSIAEGNHHGTGVGSDSSTIQDGDYNYTEVLKAFTNVSTDAGVNSLLSQQNGVRAMVAGGGTAAHYGMTKAKYLLDEVKSRESTKVVVFFTDGIPGMTGWANGFANGAISAAQDIKKSTENGGYGAIVYSIAVFGNLGNNETNANTFMNFVSSNYPNASSMTNGGTGSDQGYYQDASNSDLTAIFKDIASAASQSDNTVGASTQIRDVVSNSFILPEGASANDVTIYTMDITEDGNGWENRQTPTGVTPQFKTTTCSDGVEREMLSVEGFDFTSPDVKDEHGYTTRENAGNFVGERYKSKTETFWAGKKLVIEFKVQASEEATGGDDSATNHPDSGVYIYNADTDTYSNVNHYPVPHTDLPLIIKITKDGLRHGESATFEIHMFDPLTDDDGNIMYNAIGKPRPDTTTERNWSKVILTNKGIDGDPVTKILMALDPHYVYRIVEDDWAWSYELSGSGQNLTTADVELNPFVFTNTEKTGVVKHAEAVSINHFGYTIKAGEFAGEQEEHYKSSKVKSF